MPDTLSEIEQKHRKQNKELQSQIQNLKKSSGKLDKKKKKEIQDEISRLEVELELKHLEELNLYKSQSPSDIGEIVENETGRDDISTARVSKAQKRRDKKAAEDKARETMISLQEIENVNGPRNIEMLTIKKLLHDKGLTLFLIPSNGDCLYSAIAHQLTQSDRPSITVESLRKMTADNIRCCKEEFMPFLTNPDSGDMLTDEDFEEYCTKIANTTTWGGQIELQAMSTVLKCPIHVLQASAPSIIIQGGQFDGTPLIIAYHRHMYGLGEHYNSTQKHVVSSDEEEFSTKE